MTQELGHTHGDIVCVRDIDGSYIVMLFLEQSAEQLSVLYEMYPQHIYEIIRQHNILYNTDYAV